MVIDRVLLPRLRSLLTSQPSTQPASVNHFPSNHITFFSLPTRRRSRSSEKNEGERGGGGGGKRRKKDKNRGKVDKTYGRIHTRSQRLLQLLTSRRCVVARRRPTCCCCFFSSISPEHEALGKRMLPDFILYLPSTEVMIPTQGLSPGLFGRRTRSLGRGGRRGGTSFVLPPLGGMWVCVVFFFSFFFGALVCGWDGYVIVEASGLRFLQRLQRAILFNVGGSASSGAKALAR